MYVSGLAVMMIVGVIGDIVRGVVCVCVCVCACVCVCVWVCVCVCVCFFVLVLLLFIYAVVYYVVRRMLWLYALL